MVNEIYNMAHNGLSDMISARAATNILNKALTSGGYKKESLDYPQIKELMQGYVYEELRNILPSDGVKRQIRNIVKEISKEYPKNSKDISQNQTIQTETTAIDTMSLAEADTIEEENALDSGYVNSVKAVFDGVDGFDSHKLEHTSFDSVFTAKTSQSTNIEIEAEAASKVIDTPETSNDKYDDISDDLFEAVSNQSMVIDEEELDESLEDKTVEKPIAKNQIHRRVIKKLVEFGSIELSDLENLLQNFALVEETKAVAIVASNGKLVNSRGKGFDLDNLAILSNMALMLLKKSGKIRSYHLSVDGSQLFLFPVAKHLVVVIGSQEINFGEVFSVFTTFEEEI